MKIHALTTGSRARQAQLPLSQARARAGSLTCSYPAAFSDPLPIHCWAIEHDGVAAAGGHR